MEIMFDSSEVKLSGNKLNFTVVDRKDNSGAWVALGDNKVIAAFIQQNIPACTIYNGGQSNLFLVLDGPDLKLQFTDVEAKTTKLYSYNELLEALKSLKPAQEAKASE